MRPVCTDCGSYRIRTVSPARTAQWRYEDKLRGASKVVRYRGQHAKPKTSKWAVLTDAVLGIGCVVVGVIIAYQI